MKTILLGQTNSNAETQRNAEERREEEPSANLRESPRISASLRLCVNSPQASTWLIYCSAGGFAIELR